MGRLRPRGAGVRAGDDGRGRLGHGRRGTDVGGGIGHLARTYGLSCDNLLAADVVTADGDLVHASETENPELFWGLRGGGGNFGIVTPFEFDLHEVGPEILAGPIFHRSEDAVDVLRFYREFVADAPDEVACYAMFTAVPPEPHQGDTAVVLSPSYSGSISDGEAALRPLRAFVDPIFDGVQPIPYAALQQSLDEGQPEGNRYYFKSHYVNEISDEAIETIVAYADPLPAPLTLVGFESMGGAISDVAPTATAYPHREAAYSFGIWSGWSDPDRDDEMIDWTREFYEAVAPYATGGMYANYLDQDDDERVVDAFAGNYERLVDLKNEWDPENLFRLNQNVEPTG